MRDKKILVFGATSAIAAETLKLLTANDLILVGRNEEKLAVVEQDLRTRGARSVTTKVAEIGEPETAEKAVLELKEEHENFDMVIVAHGNLPDQESAISSYAESKRALEINFLSVVAILTPIANYMEEWKRGTIVVIGSVAGDRGRQSNYVYGCAKGATALFLQGLRNRLAKSGVHVLTVKPGFVDTPMTSHLKKGPLFAQPDSIAQGIMRAVEKGRNEIYLPWFWLPIMTAIRNIPELVFKRMSL